MPALVHTKDRACPQCGKLIMRRSSMCRDCYAAKQTKAERNRRICELYNTGEYTAAQLGAMFGLSGGRVRLIATEVMPKVFDPAEAPTPFVRKSRNGKRIGRPVVWPDCPPELQGEYHKLRRAYGIRSMDARSMLEAGRDVA